MINTLLKKIIGSKNERELRRIRPYIERINQPEPELKALKDHQLRSKTNEFKERLSRGESIEDILYEAYAVVRETSRRVLNMRHFDVQLVGGVVLHEGKIAEMATGEGKTLVATLPAYLNALSGSGVHIVTVNDYLAKRDREWMGPIYEFLGLSVGAIQHAIDDKDRKDAYLSDVTYGTNNEFGFDYLRDNMKFSFEDYVQRELNYAIVDEVDSILIDEARTPLIISGPSEESTDKYYKIDTIIPSLRREKDYQIEEKTKTANLTEEGVFKVEKLLKIDNLYDPKNMEILHHVNQALKARTLFKKDVDYVVKKGEVIIVDEFTGRLMPGRRYSDGLHQALEAKEKVKIESENQTLASITFQNYFRMYNKLAGMTGTADTEAAEFKAIYNLDVVVVPTNRSLIRYNYSDVIYRTEGEKFNAVVDEIGEFYKKGRPVLVGTISIEKSEKLSKLLKMRGVKHNVLNAKHHEKEAEIVAQAGRLGAVTIATNMAGRGTDIVLGGNKESLASDLLRKKGTEPLKATDDERKEALHEVEKIVDNEHERVVELDGLFILGTERHEARRIDNQLRGRAGRQGDPGASRFYLSLEDDLLRIFGSDRISGIMSKLGMEEGQPIEHGMITKAIENAQRKVEGHNFDIRKHLLEYDDVMNKQREVIYKQRREILEGEGLREVFFDMVEDVLDEIIEIYAPEDSYADEWNLKGLIDTIDIKFSLDININEWMKKIEETNGKVGRDELRDASFEKIKDTYDAKEREIGEAMMRHLEKMVMLQVVDNLWKDHLLNMDYLKEGIGLRGYGQKNPLNEYKREGFEMFMGMMERIKEEVVDYLFKIKVEGDHLEISDERSKKRRLLEHRGQEIQQRGPDDNGRVATVKREGKKIGRNEPCPCGSGKKYKKCCGV
ncbi:MAG TPA: preprotein translocase subunit SecA [Nitrospinota bacterium]|nr:preprotein translocase subunit SecA [Nitrospinota bacterium]